MNANEQLRREIHPEIRVVDAKAGLVEYVASDETIDSYREVIRASGWKFNRFAKNAPFVDSHDYSTVEKLVGSVVDFAVKGKQLVETVKWAIDVAENKLAQLGWKMTEAGYLKAVSVGFMPTKMVTRWDGDRETWSKQIAELGIDEKKTPINGIFIEQEQIELSSCIIGANPNALAKSYKAGILDDATLEMISLEQTKRNTVSAAAEAADVALARQRQREAFLGRFERILKSL
jgi:hypothetical protein